MPEHTKLSLRLPLKFRPPNQVLGGYELADQSDLTVAICLNKPCADWVFHRCNNHDQLVDNLKRALDLIYVLDFSKENKSEIDEFIATIEAAEKE